MKYNVKNSVDTVVSLIHTVKTLEFNSVIHSVKHSVVHTVFHTVVHTVFFPAGLFENKHGRNSVLL